MGCDIHLFIEHKVDNHWEAVKIFYKEDNEYKVADVYNGRYYELFALLAGVRGCHKPLVSPRGLPSDLSDYVQAQYDWFEGDAHTPTWYDLNEMFMLKQLHPDRSYCTSEDDPYDNPIPAFHSLIDTICNYIEFSGEMLWDINPGDYRVVIWFDS